MLRFRITSRTLFAKHIVPLKPKFFCSNNLIVKDDSVIFIDEKIQEYSEKFTTPPSDFLNKIESETKVLLSLYVAYQRKKLEKDQAE